jgi:hypothetical protein
MSAIFNALDSPHGQYASFYGRLFDFLSGKDLVGKLKVLQAQTLWPFTICSLI